jgi:hypothetical protein
LVGVVGLRVEDAMRLASFSVTVFLALMPSAVQAQQSPGAPGDTIGHPPPLPGPPPLSDPPQRRGRSRPPDRLLRATPVHTRRPAHGRSRSEGPGLNTVSSDGISPHERSKRCLAGRGTRDRWVYHLCGNPRSKSWQAVDASRHRRNRVHDGIDVCGDLGRPAVPPPE